MEPEIIAELSAAAEGNFNDLSALLRRAIAAYRAIATERDHMQRGFNAAVQTVEVRDARINTLEAALKHATEYACMDKPDCSCKRPYEEHCALRTTAETGPVPCPICTAPAGTHFINCERWELLGTTAETKASPAIDPSHSDLAPDTYFPDGKPRLDSETSDDAEHASYLKTRDCEHVWQEVDAYPFKAWKCTNCGATKT